MKYTMNEMFTESAVKLNIERMVLGGKFYSQNQVVLEQFMLEKYKMLKYMCNCDTGSKGTNAQTVQVTVKTMKSI